MKFGKADIQKYTVILRDFPENRANVSYIYLGAYMNFYPHFPYSSHDVNEIRSENSAHNAVQYF